MIEFSYPTSNHRPASPGTNPAPEVVPVALVAGIAKQILEDDSAAGEVGNPERQETAPPGRAEIRAQSRF